MSKPKTSDFHVICTIRTIKENSFTIKGVEDYLFSMEDEIQFNIFAPLDTSLEPIFVAIDKEIAFSGSCLERAILAHVFVEKKALLLNIERTPSSTFKLVSISQNEN